MHELGGGYAFDPLDLESEMLERLWQLYSHDLSESRFTLPTQDGLFKLGHLALYRANRDEWRAYLLSHEGRPAGFAIIGLRWQGDRRTMGDFFVARGVRRKGAGASFAKELIRRHPGTWEIAFQANNPGAPEFWRGVVGAIVGGAWREELRPVPNKPHIPPDHWLVFETS